MKKNLLLIMLINLSIVAIGQTSISGLISVNTNWTVDNSPYIITGNTLIMNGVSLIIDAGVSIKLENNTTIQVNGELKAVGDSVNKITFTSNNSSPSNGDWNHIIFSDNSKDAVYNSEGNYQSGSIIKYCEFSYGGGVNLGTININKSRPHIEFSTVSKSSSDGIYINNANPKIYNCNILNNNGAGILSPNYLYQHDIEISNCIINNNIGGGIQIKSAGNGVLKFINNNISNNLKNAIFVNSTGGSGSGSIKIENNIIDNNSFSKGAGIFIEGGFDIDIKCNRISNNSGFEHSAMYMEEGFNPYTINIINNIFSNNSTTNGPVIEFRYRISYPTTFNIENNSFIENKAPSNSILYIWGSLDYNAFKLNKNTFKDNSGNSTLRLFDFNGTINNNNFFNQNTNYSIYNLNETGELNINAKSNFWETNDINIINVYDWFDNGALSVIELSPILNDAVMTFSDCSFPDTTLSINNTNLENIEHKIWPNPFYDEFKISINSIENLSLDIEIYSMQGKLVKKQSIVNYKDYIKVQRETLKPGIYLCKIVIDNKYTKTTKLLAK